MRLLKALLMGTAILIMGQQATAQGMSGSLHPYWDEAETIPYFEEYGAEEEATYIASTCHRYEVPIGEEEAYFESTAIVPCDETFEGCTDGFENEYGVLGSTGTGPHYYNNHKHTCDPDLGPHANRVRIKSGSHQNAGTNANIWMCFGRHMEHYSSTNPDYDRPETLWYDDTPAGQDAACFNLGKGPSAPNTWVNYYFCWPDDWNDFFSWLEPDDWKFIRFWMPSTNGLQIDTLVIKHNNQIIYEETGMDYWFDKYYNRQLFMDWRIAQYKHDRMAAIVGEDYMLSILELAAQDLGFSGARKYSKDDEGQCSEFAVYAIQQSEQFSSLCPTDRPRPLIDGDIGCGDMYQWFFYCNYSSRVIDDIYDHPELMKPGYYLSLHGRGHSVIFVDWVGAVGGEFYVIDSNGYHTNTVALYNRGDWGDGIHGNNAMDDVDFAGKTY